MKNYILFLAFLISGRLFAIDRFVDPALSNGNGTTLFTTITSAVSAAVNGDRILIVPGTYNEPALTLGKSLTLLSQTAGTTINFNGNITIAGFAGMKLEILGFNLGIYSISSSAISGGSAANRAKISIIDSKMIDLKLDNSYYDLICARCLINNAVYFTYGSFIVSKTQNLYISDEAGSNFTDSKILIAADTITSTLSVLSDNYPLVIANCLLNNLYFWLWNNNANNTNYIRNNLFNADAQLLLTENPPAYNFEFSSNEFIGTTLFSFPPTNICFPTGVGYYGQYVGQLCPNGPCCVGFGSSTFTNPTFPNPNISGFFRWTYNGIDLPCRIPVAPQPLVLTKIVGVAGTTIDAGNPNHDYYDIDLTINDRGRSGGPYSILNYYPTINPSNGKAFIFDLEMPTDIYTGQQVDIKAKGYHKN